MKQNLRWLKFLFIALVLPLIAQASTDDTMFDTGSIENWTWTPRVSGQMNFVLDQKPSSLRGRTSNDWGLLTFSSDFAHKEEPFAVSMSASYGPDRDASSEQPSI